MRRRAWIEPRPRRASRVLLSLLVATVGQNMWASATNPSPPPLPASPDPSPPPALEGGGYKEDGLGTHQDSRGEHGGFECASSDEGEPIDNYMHGLPVATEVAPAASGEVTHAVTSMRRFRTSDADPSAWSSAADEQRQCDCTQPMSCVIQVKCAIM